MRNQTGFKLRWCPVLAAVLAVVLVLTFLAAPAVAQEQGHEHHEHGEDHHDGMPQGEMSAEQQAMYEAWMQAATPGEEHARLAELAGDWTMTVKSWEDPDADPTVSQGTATYELIMGGRFLRETVNSTMMGMPFVGESLSGYDNVTGKYWGTWIDNMSTGVSVFEGDWDAESDAMVMHGEYVDPMSGEPAPVKTVTTFPSDDEMVFEWWGEVPGSDAGMVKMMEITYVRQ